MLVGQLFFKVESTVVLNLTGCLCDAVLGLVKRKELHGAILVSDGADPQSGNTATHRANAHQLSAQST